MAESDNRQLEHDLEQALADLKANHDPERRRDLLRNLRRLVADADRHLVEPTE